MTMSPTQIENEALKLSARERACLAERLLESLGEDPQDLNEDRWIEEAERRIANATRGA
jgi:putative addiction module component (TIGR02574 family)